MFKTSKKLTPEKLMKQLAKDDDSSWEEDEKFYEAMKDRDIRQRMEGYVVLGKAADGFHIEACDYEGYRTIVRSPSDDNAFIVKNMRDIGDSVVQIYIEDGEVRAI